MCSFNKLCAIKFIFLFTCIKDISKILLIVRGSAYFPAIVIYRFIWKFSDMQEVDYLSKNFSF